MFGLFKKTAQPKTVVDEFIEIVWGKNAKKTALLAEAIPLASDELLGGVFDSNVVTQIATGLDNGPMPYSTHDLATAVAMRLLKDIPEENRHEYMEIQLMARMKVLSWAKEGKVAKALLRSIEDTLYERYRP